MRLSGAPPRKIMVMDEASVDAGDTKELLLEFAALEGRVALYDENLLSARGGSVSLPAWSSFSVLDESDEPGEVVGAMDGVVDRSKGKKAVFLLSFRSMADGAKHGLLYDMSTSSTIEPLASSLSVYEKSSVPSPLYDEARRARTEWLRALRSEKRERRGVAPAAAPAAAAVKPPPAKPPPAKPPPAKPPSAAERKPKKPRREREPEPEPEPEPGGRGRGGGRGGSARRATTLTPHLALRGARARQCTGIKTLVLARARSCDARSLARSRSLSLSLACGALSLSSALSLALALSLCLSGAPFPHWPPACRTTEPPRITYSQHADCLCLSVYARSHAGKCKGLARALDDAEPSPQDLAHVAARGVQAAQGQWSRRRYAAPGSGAVRVHQAQAGPQGVQLRRQAAARSREPRRCRRYPEADPEADPEAAQAAQAAQARGRA